MDKIIKKNIADACEEWQLIFAANKNAYRVMPSFQDGLKPGARRFLYALYRMGSRPSSKYVKMAIGRANALEFHPHGEQPIADTAAAMTNPIKNNLRPTDGKGNFGSYKDEKAGAGRYIEVKLSEYGWKCYFEDYDSAVVDLKRNYANTADEPEFLPARYPHVLFNPQFSGIGWGDASNVPPYNPAEVMKATINLIKNPTKDVFLVPDSPTGADIVDDGQFETICRTGVGTLTMRGHIEVDELNNTLTITSIPLQTTIDAILKNIANMKTNGIFDEIKNMTDHTKNETGVRSTIYLDPSADPYKTIEKLYKKKTGLKKTFPVQIRLIDDYKPFMYGITSLLHEWIEYREEIVRAIYNSKLNDAEEKQNINDVLLFILNEDNAEETNRICRTAENKEDIASKLMKRYGIDSQKANVIASMKNYELSKEYAILYKRRKIELAEMIKEYERILNSDEEIDNIIIAQLEEGIKLFGQKRRSRIVKDDDNAEIPNTEHIIAISADGYIKKIHKSDKRIGQVGKINDQYLTMVANNLDDILLFDSTGYITKIAVSNIPDMVFEDIGIPVTRYIPQLLSCDRVVSSLVLPDKTTLKKSGRDNYFIFLTKQGYVKRTKLTDFANINGSMQAIKIPKDDELVTVDIVAENTSKDLIIYTNFGNGIRRDINEFSIMKPLARGVRQLTMTDGEYCVGFDKINPKKKYIFYLTSSGRVKLTETKYFPTMKRKDEVLSLIPLVNGESLVGLHSVSLDDSVIVYKKKSNPVEIVMNGIKVSSRIAKPEKLVKMYKGDSVLSFTVITD